MANGHIQLCVADTGKGIEKDNLKKIFKPFLLERSQRHPDGFGLNLPMARSIMSALGGKIWAESAGIGKGAVISLEMLPG